MAGRSQWLPLSLVFVMIGCSNELSPTIVVLSVQDQRGFVEHEYRDSHGTKSKYIVFVPENFDPQTPSPAILFLHGAGQTGSDGERQAQGGLGEAIRARLSTFPFIVVFPPGTASGGCV